MNRANYIIYGAAAVALGFGSAAHAGQDQHASAMKSQASQQGRQSAAPAAHSQTAQRESTAKDAQKRAAKDDQSIAPAIVIGELVDMRTVKLTGKKSASHQLLKLKARDGETVVVDIGAVDSAVTQTLQQGDKVLAVGRAGRINDRPVIFARSVGELYATGVSSAGSQSTQNKLRSAERTTSASDGP